MSYDPEEEQMDPYAVLEISQDADQETIESAYFALATANHPQRAQNAEEHAIRTKKTQEIINAYALLSDPVAVAAYREKVSVADYESLRKAERHVETEALPSDFVAERGGFDMDKFNSVFSAKRDDPHYNKLAGAVGEGNVSMNEYSQYIVDRGDIEMPPPDASLLDGKGQLSMDEFNKQFEARHAAESSGIQEAGRVGAFFGGSHGLKELDNVLNETTFEGGDMSQIVNEPIRPGEVDEARATGKLSDMMEQMRADREVVIEAGGLFDCTNVETGVGGHGNSVLPIGPFHVNPWGAADLPGIVEGAGEAGAGGVDVFVPGPAADSIEINEDISL